MKRLLAWDSSTEDALISLAECSDDLTQVHLIAFKKEYCQAKQSERLLEMVHEVLSESKINLSDVDAFAVGEGPGSFTGIRIGFTTAVTLAQVLEKPVITVSSLALALREMFSEPFPNDTLVGFYRKACLGEGYLLLGPPSSLSDYVSYHSKHSQVTQVVVKESNVSSAIEQSMQANGLSHWQVEGNDFASIELTQLNNALRLTRVGQRQTGSDPENSALQLAKLAVQAWRSGGQTNPLEVSPIYLRESDAERKLKQGLLKQSPIA